MFAAVLSLMRAQVFRGIKRGKSCREPGVSGSPGRALWTGQRTSLLKTVGGYVNETEARKVIGRQMAKSGATPESLDAESLKKIAYVVAGPAGLYVAEVTRRSDLAKKIAVLAGMEGRSPL
jgi:hypothetical protein